MATYHCSVKIGKAGKGAAHAAYIAREGKYARLLDSPKAERLEHVEHLNMPGWAQSDPMRFWRAADRYERKNGAVYREFELALPNELTPEQSVELVREFVQQEIGDKHACTWAIHNGNAALDRQKRNRNAHIMFSERLRDGIDRDPEHYFKRANKKQPECGGCLKANLSATHKERRAALVELRARWADLQNEHLALHAHSSRVDHRSLNERGLERISEPHLGWRKIRRMTAEDVSVILQRRVAEGELERAQREVRAQIDVSSNLAAARRQRERQLAQQNAYARRQPIIISGQELEP